LKHRHKKGFKKSTLRLADNHTWQVPKGYKIVVADRGAISFNIPASWFLAKMEPLELYDHEPPKDDARITVSFWRLPPGVDWSGLPLSNMLTDATKDEPYEILERGELTKSSREDIELVWTERRFMDPQEKREAFSRIALARGFNVQALVTFDFWLDDLEKSKPVWDEVLRSIQLGRTIEDPTKGAVRH
jgi:hypothetical protein